MPHLQQNPFVPQLLVCSLNFPFFFRINTGLLKTYPVAPCPVAKKSATALCATAAIFSACFLWGGVVGLKNYGY
jgi:hypothetical protein